MLKEVIITGIKSDVPNKGIITCFTMGVHDYIPRQFTAPIKDFHFFEQCMVCSTIICIDFDY